MESARWMAFNQGIACSDIHEGEARSAGREEATHDTSANVSLHALEMRLRAGRAARGVAGAVITAPVSKRRLYKIGFRDNSGQD